MSTYYDFMVEAKYEGTGRISPTAIGLPLRFV